jgi:hypothetical protein
VPSGTPHDAAQGVDGVLITRSSCSSEQYSWLAYVSMLQSVQVMAVTLLPFFWHG